MAESGRAPWFLVVALLTSLLLLGGCSEPKREPPTWRIVDCLRHVARGQSKDKREAARRIDNIVARARYLIHDSGKPPTKMIAILDDELNHLLRVAAEVGQDRGCGLADPSASAPARP